MKRERGRREGQDGGLLVGEWAYIWMDGWMDDRRGGREGGKCMREGRGGEGGSCC